MSTPLKKAKSGILKKRTAPRKRRTATNTAQTSGIQKKKKLEVHFQDGFYHDTISIAQNDEIILTVALTTRMQTGLAGIETIEIREEIPLTFRLNETQIEHTKSVPGDIPLVTVNLENNELIIQPMTHHPGYL